MDTIDSLGYTAVCDGTGSPTAILYTGPGPHTVDFEGNDDFYGYNNRYIDDSNGTLVTSSGSDIEPAGWIPISAADVELVACVTTKSTATRVGSCSYENPPQPIALDAAQYTLTLYVAQTGQKLTGPVTVLGSDQTCPETVLSYSGSRPAAYTSLSLAQIEAIIGKYVQ